MHQQFNTYSCLLDYLIYNIQWTNQNRLIQLELAMSKAPNCTKSLTTECLMASRDCIPGGTATPKSRINGMSFWSCRYI